MFYYFGYGSNLNVALLRAAGVSPLRSEPAILEGWRLRFNVPDFFRVEGTTANVEPHDGEAVHGVLHACRSTDRETVDHIEALGIKYQRVEMPVTTYGGFRRLAYVYTGVPSILDDEGAPSLRYRDALVYGAIEMKLNTGYVAWLRAVQCAPPPSYPPFSAPRGIEETFTLEDLLTRPTLTALAGMVFDMAAARPEHGYLRSVLGGKDVTVIVLKRMPTSDGRETTTDVRLDRLTEEQRRYLNAYLHEFAREYRFVGRLEEREAASARYVLIGAPSSLRRPGQPRVVPAQPREVPAKLPARSVLERAASARRELGHENRGPLSEEYGFMPQKQPRRRLPQAFAIWDQIATSLPDLYRTLALRREIDRLPELVATPTSLPDGDLLRAAMVLAMLSHAYWYVETRPPERLPEALARPWAEVRRRLDRGPAVLTYFDLIVYNWVLVNPTRPDPMRLDNLRLLVPTVDTDEERVFYLTQTEILAQCSPAVGAIVRAQEAVVADDPEALESELLTIIGCLQRVVRESLLGINPSASSATHVDPVVWAKTVAPFAVPMQPGVQGPSGTSSPIFNTLDVFLGRKKFESFLGREIHQLRDTYPIVWREFLVALGETSVTEYIERRGHAHLKGLLNELVETYAGPNGFLGRHRMKVYGYLELAFKVGRSVTIGGFRGVFKDRTWEQVDTELESARIERTQAFPRSCYPARVKRVTATEPSVFHVVLDISGTGTWHEAGDRCGVLPENSPELVERTCAALRAHGDEQVRLTEEWRNAVQLRWGYAGQPTALPLRDVLRFGVIRPVSTGMAEALYKVSRSELLKDSITRRATHRWELWDLLELLARSGFDPTQLWRSAGAEPSDAICRLILPERFRMYSIASTMSSADVSADAELHLAVSRVRYESSTVDGEPPIERLGTASSFLARAAGRTEPISIIIQHPPRFSLPRDPRAPIVMLAGGTGVSAFRSFMAERQRSPAAGESWLFLGLRFREQFCYGDELAPAVASGALKLRVAFSRDDVDLEFVEAPGGGRFVERPGKRRRVTDLLLEDAAARALWELFKLPGEGDQAACLYICGRSRFAKSALDVLKAVFRRFAEGNEVERDVAAQRLIRRLVAEGRLMQEIFSGHDEQALPEMDLSEIARYNDARQGYRTVIEGRVYDMTEFLRVHPGGARILQAYAGMDATQGYARAHAARTEIDAMREMYVIGKIRPIELERVSATVVGPRGAEELPLEAAYRTWVNLLHTVVEMQNALYGDQALQAAIVARGDVPSPRSPYKLQRAVETHERFLRSYVDLLSGSSWPNLWAITRAFFAPEADPEWMRERLAVLRGSDHARYVEALPQPLDEAISQLVARPEDKDLRARIEAACAVLEHESRKFLSRVREVTIAAVAVFEELGPGPRLAGASRIVSACRALPHKLDRYFEGVATKLSEARWCPPGFQLQLRAIYDAGAPPSSDSGAVPSDPSPLSGLGPRSRRARRI